MQYIVRFLLIAVCYVIAGKLGLQLAFINASTTAVWAPTGIALAAFLLFGYRVWPAIFLGAFITNITTAGTFGSSLGIALGNTLEGIIGAYLINTFAHGKAAFLRTQDIFKFVILAAILSTTVSANIGVLSLILTGNAHWSQFIPIWFTWWMGNASGALIVTPFIIFWSSTQPLKWTKNWTIELPILLWLLISLGMILFGGFVTSLPLEFLCIPVIVWIAFRFGRRETITAIMLLAGMAILGTLYGFGPFARLFQNESLLLLQAFMDIVTVTALVLSAAVSEKEELQEVMHSQEDRFKALIEKSSEAIILTDQAGNIMYVSPSFSRILGYDPEEVIGKSGIMFIHPSDVKHTIDITSQIVEKPGKSVVLETRCLHKDGSVKNIEVTTTNLLDTPSVMGVISNFHDITQRNIFEEKMAKEKAEDEALLASIGDGIIATDPDGKIILVNRAFEELLGWKKHEIVGKSEIDILGLQADDGAAILEKDRPLRLALKAKKKITVTHYLLRKDGTRFPALIAATPVLLNKKIIGGIKIFHDVTREKELDLAKDEFISLASHELRTPMTAIKGLTSMILDGEYGPINTGLKKPLNNISISSDRQVHLINDLLDVSRLQTGRINFKLANVSLKQVLLEVIASMQPIVKQNDISLKIKDFDDIQIQADEVWIKQIISNLLSNALKFTKSGSITLSIRLENDFVFVSIKDTGIGIDPSNQGKLFERFRQLESNTPVKAVGSGLGLYISRGVARKIGGDIFLEESSRGKGSTFVVSLPKANTPYSKKVSDALQKEMKIAFEKKRG